MSALEDDYTQAELDTLQAQWDAHQQQERQRIMEGLIAHHKLDQVTGGNTAVTLAEKLGFTEEFNQYLTSLKAEGGKNGDQDK